ncbi:MAG: hypothetical protein IT551_07015 [Novosphingobium sp.]|nr:hypothetical protein [Novosphingobium sp.]
MIALITGNLWRALAAFLGGLVVILLIQIHGLPIIGGGLVSRLERITALNDANVKSHRQTKDNFRAAMADAQRREVFRLARVKAETERNNDARETAVNARLTALRTRYDSLRRERGASPTSATGGVDVSGLPVPAFGADAASDADGLSTALMCSTYAVQLDELISWVEAQAAVNVNEERK